MTTRSGPLFQEPSVPAGFSYREGFITAAEEVALLDALSTVCFSAFELRGVVARRRVAFFGESYDRTEALPFPDFLLPVRDRIAAWSQADAHAFAMALINEYPPGAPDWLASRCPAVRHRRGTFPTLSMPHEIPALPLASGVAPARQTPGHA